MNKRLKPFVFSLLITFLFSFVLTGCTVSSNYSESKTVALHPSPSYMAVKVGEKTRINLLRETLNGLVEEVPRDKLEFIIEPLDIENTVIEDDTLISFKKGGKYELRMRMMEEKSVKGKMTFFAYDDENTVSTDAIKLNTLDEIFIKDGVIMLKSEQKDEQKDKDKTSEIPGKKMDSGTAEDILKKQKENPTEPGENDDREFADPREKEREETIKHPHLLKKTETDFSEVNKKKSDDVYKYMKEHGAAEVSYKVKIDTKNYYVKGKEYASLNMNVVPAIKIYMDSLTIPEKDDIAILVTDYESGGLKNIFYTANTGNRMPESEYFTTFPSPDGLVIEHKIQLDKYEIMAKDYPDMFIEEFDFKFLVMSDKKHRFEIITDVFKDNAAGINFFSKRKLIEFKLDTETSTQSPLGS